MKRRITKIISVIMTVAVLLGVSGCGTSIKGDWYVTAIKKGEKTYNIEQLAESLGSSAGDKVSILLRINDDGSFVLMDVSAGNSSYEDGSSLESTSSENASSETSHSSSLAEGKYKKKDDSYIFRIKGQDVVKGTVNDGKLVLETETDSDGDSESISIILEKE